jgi:hypothetical protein
VGYFRATHRFFVSPFSSADVAHVTQQLGYTPEQVDLDTYDDKHQPVDIAG